MKKNCFIFLLIFLLSGSNGFAASAEQTPAPVADLPAKLVGRNTIIKVEAEGTDSLGARLATRLKERFNQSSLFSLSSEDEKDAPELRLLLNTVPEFPSRPNIGSVYGVCWVLSPGKGYLGHLLGREVGTVNAEDLDGLVDKLVERTDGIAARYANLLK